MKITKNELRQLIREATKDEGDSSPEMTALQAAVEAYADVNGWPATITALEGMKAKARATRVSGMKRSAIQGVLPGGKKSRTAFYNLSDADDYVGTGSGVDVSGYVLNPKALRELADALRKLSSGDMAPAAGRKVVMDIV
tara:strand:+ start:231 stop:650 length:420 start_codon:yes stop_codon:yes gene_type:complete